MLRVYIAACRRLPVIIQGRANLCFLHRLFQLRFGFQLYPPLQERSFATLRMTYFGFTLDQSVNGTAGGLSTLCG